MSSTYWFMSSFALIIFLYWSARKKAKDLFVVATFVKPQLFRYVPYAINHASRILIDDPQGYIERHPIRILHALETIADSPDVRMRNMAMKAIVENIRSVASRDEGEAARALLTVINKSDSSSLSHHRALIMRPTIIDSLAQSDPVQAVLLAQKGIMNSQDEGELYNQSCELALKHLHNAFTIEPIIAAHAACNIARNTQGGIRESAIWTLLSHMNMISAADPESGHAAAEQAVLLSTVDTPLHQAALSMWDWHIRSVQVNNPSELISKIFYGFGISTSPGPNKWALYEHGLDFLLQDPDIIRDHCAAIVKVSLCIGLKANQPLHMHQKIVQVWTAALKELCTCDLHQALRAANEAMTYTAPGSQFERQAQIACLHLKRLDDEIFNRAEMV